MLLRFSEDDPKDPGENVRADDEVPRTWIISPSVILFMFLINKGAKGLIQKSDWQISEVSPESLFLVGQILLVLTSICLLTVH